VTLVSGTAQLTPGKNWRGNVPHNKVSRVKSSGAPLSVPPPRDLERDADLAGALHEVSNALTVVLGWLDVASAKLAEGPAADAVSVARTHARLGHQIARAAIGAEVPVREVEQKSATALAEDAALGIAPHAERRQVVVSVEVGPCGVRIHDFGAALQILTNLLLNAVDFSPTGGRVVLHVREAAAGVVFSVQDEGPGIDPDRIATLLSTAVSTRRGGAGVGLRHSAALAKSHGGELCVVSSGPGACFELSWPAAEARSSVRPSADTRPAVRGARVLVVEDDAAVRSLVELALQTRGADAVSVASRKEFFDLLDTAPSLQAVLIDLSPLAEDVVAAFERLEEVCPNVPVILISGVASGAPEAVAHRVAAWVRKPFEMGEVLDVLAEVLGAVSRPGAIRR
jgi:CheY-like chemotaxis protein